MLKKHRNRFGAVAVCLYLVCHSNAAHAQSDAEVQVSPIEFRITYFECVTPAETVPCVSWRDETRRQEDCPSCTEWRRQTAGGLIPLSLSTDTYAYTDGPPRSNFLIRDVAEQVYDVEFPTTDYGYPITTTQLFQDYESYGWIEVPDDSSKAGSVAVWEGFAGVVVEDVDKESPKLLISSDKHEGNLEEISVADVGRSDTPRYVVPKQFVEAAQSREE